MYFVARTCCNITVTCHYMETLQKQSDKSNNKLLWTLPYILILVGLYFSFAGLSEFYNVAIKDETGAYPWGAVNEVAWYYQTPSTYSTYNLASGLLFSAATISTLWGTLKKHKRLVVAGVSLTVLFLFADLISANIQ
jgi:hypothetical protein